MSAMERSKITHLVKLQERKPKKSFASLLSDMLKDVKIKEQPGLKNTFKPALKRDSKKKRKRDQSKKSRPSSKKEKVNSSKKVNRSFKKLNHSLPSRSQENKKKRKLVLPDAVTWSLGEVSQSLPSFAKRGGYDPWFSTKDVKIEDIGNKGGNYVKQNVSHYSFDSINQVEKINAEEKKWSIWLDPSASANIIVPHEIYSDGKKCKTLQGVCPSTVNLAKEFGTKVEYIYMSPPWDSSSFGYGVKGHFTVDHLRKIDFSKVQEHGFVFIWVEWSKVLEILRIFDEKGYFFADSSTCILTEWAQGRIDCARRNPDLKSTTALDRLAGNGIHGILFKKKTKVSFRIGNQVVVDCCFLRKLKDPYTGQLQMDHGYGYEIYQYLLVNKKQGTQALHLFCPPDFNRANWGGVSYYKRKA